MAAAARNNGDDPVIPQSNIPDDIVRDSLLAQLAAAYFANGQTDKAIETEEKALARDPDNDSYKKAMQKYLAATHGSR